jgi:hypothetical protein
VLTSGTYLSLSVAFDLYSPREQRAKTKAKARRQETQESRLSEDETMEEKVQGQEDEETVPAPEQMFVVSFYVIAL